MSPAHGLPDEGRNSIRVLLAEDHNLFRAGIRSLLDNLPDVQVVAEASSGREALRLIELHKPDVVLMDITMPGMNGIEVTARVARQFPEVRVIVLSMHADEEYVWQALRAGAIGYMLKDADTAELELAIKAGTRGNYYLSPSISKHLVRDYVQRAGGEPNLLDRLTPRQREIMQLLVEGRTTHQIAQILNLSTKTVETHRVQLMERLQIRDIPTLVRYAIRMGMISPGE